MSQTDRRKYFRNLLLHFRPSTVPERTLRFTFTWGLGGMAAVLLLLLFASGLLLKFIYQPVVAQAYSSIIYLEQAVPFGQLLRNLHRWSGYGLIITSFLHLLRVFYTAAHVAPRQVNWLIGLALFAMALFSNFTGYLLPWDQIAYWAVTVSTSMLDYIPWVGSPLKQLVLGGSEPGQTALMNFYALHTAVLPALIVFVLPFHFWRIRKADGLVVPRRPGQDPADRGPEADAMPHLIVRELTVALLLIAGVVLLSMWLDAPLAEQANPGLSPNPTKAPWFFMGFQELLMHFHPLIAVLVIPTLLLAALIALPWLDPARQYRGIWFRSPAGRKAALLSAVLAPTLTAAAVILDENLSLGVALAGIDGLLSFAVMLALFLAYYLGMKRLLSLSRSEAIQAVFTLVIAAFISLTVIGAAFRGSGMQLAWSGG